MGRKAWDIIEWSNKKRELGKDLRNMKRGKISRKEYIRKKGEYRAQCKKEREEYQKKKEEKISLKTEEESWKYNILINLGKREKKVLNQNIKMKSQEKHFMDLLEGTRERKLLEWSLEEEKNKETKESRKDEEEELRQEKLVEQLKKLKKGEDEIENEAWRLISKKIGEIC